MGPYGAHMGPYTRKFPKIPKKFSRALSGSLKFACVLGPIAYDLELIAYGLELLSNLWSMAYCLELIAYGLWLAIWSR